MPGRSCKILSSMAGAFIEARDLSKTYHVGKIEVQALRGISFSVQKGEFVSVVGPSGSGKSTLFYLLGGLTRADGGSVILDGHDLARLSDFDAGRQVRKILVPGALGLVLAMAVAAPWEVDRSHCPHIPLSAARQS